MEVVRARHAGACYGVQRALDIAYEVLDDGVAASTLGSLIHNPQVVADLAARGMGVLSDASQACDGTVIIRSHGITPEERQRLDRSGVRVVDATCPHVERAQRAAADLAQSCASVLVVGEAGHPEVEALVAYARAWESKVWVVLAEDDIPSQLEGPVGIVVQTTQTRDNLDRVLGALRRRGIEPTLKDTICSATQHRQKAAAELAGEVDAMIVIGGRNSSNTTRLAEICAKACPRTHHVESAQELSEIDFEGARRIGITAGASTPEDQIAAVAARLEGLDL